MNSDYKTQSLIHGNIGCIMGGVIFISVLCSLNVCFAQPVILRGQITYQSSGSQPVVDAQVSSFGATPTKTNTFGQFELVFTDKKAGEKIRLVINKQGLEVVNRRDLEVFLRADPDDLVQIVMAKEGERNDAARSFYEISEKSINERYEKKLDQIIDNQGEIIKLRAERDLALALAKELATDFAKINLDKASNLHVLSHNP